MQGDGNGRPESKLGDATPRSLRLSKLIVNDQDDASAERVEVVTVDPLTNKVPQKSCPQPRQDAASRSLLRLLALVRAFVMCCHVRCEGSWRQQRARSRRLRARLLGAGLLRAFPSASS